MTSVPSEVNSAEAPIADGVTEGVVALLPEQVEKKEAEEDFTEPLDWTKVLDPTYIDGTLVVVGKKHESAGNQRYKVFFVSPDMINPNATPQALEALANKYPKFLVLSALMKLSGQEAKWCAPGNDAGAKKKEGKEPTKVSSLSRSFWFKCNDVTGIDPDILEAEGGEAELLKKQRENRMFLHEAQRKLAFKWWYAPMIQQEHKKKEVSLMKTYKGIDKNITWDKVVQITGEQMLGDHAAMGILSNMDSGASNIGEGIPFQSKVWYSPSDAKFRTEEMNEKAVRSYVERINQLRSAFPLENHVINEDYVKALRLGLREHIIPTFVIKDGQFELLPPNPDPCRSNLKSGDFIKVEYYINPYDNLKGAGQTLFVNRFFIYSASVGEQMKTAPLNPKYLKAKNFTSRMLLPPKLEPAVVVEVVTEVVKEETKVVTQVKPEPLATKEQPHVVVAAPAPIEARTDVDVQDTPPTTQGKAKRQKFEMPKQAEGGIPDDYNE